MSDYGFFFRENMMDYQSAFISGFITGQLVLSILILIIGFFSFALHKGRFFGAPYMVPPPDPYKTSEAQQRASIEIASANTTRTKFD